MDPKRGQCIKCKTIGLLSAGRNGVCRACWAAYMRTWAAANRAAVREQRRNKYKLDMADPAKRAQIREGKRRWEKKNKAKLAAAHSRYYDRHREKLIARVLAYQHANREKRRLACIAYRCKLRNAPGNGVTPADVATARAAQNDLCRWCHVPLMGKGEVDHVIPIKLGGAHDPSNIVLSCKSCNCRKNAKHPERFMRERGITI